MMTPFKKRSFFPNRNLMFKGDWCIILYNFSTCLHHCIHLYKIHRCICPYGPTMAPRDDQHLAPWPESDPRSNETNGCRIVVGHGLSFMIFMTSHNFWHVLLLACSESLNTNSHGPRRIHPKQNKQITFPSNSQL